jgi:hypothetical protein
MIIYIKPKEKLVCSQDDIITIRKGGVFIIEYVLKMEPVVYPMVNRNGKKYRLKCQPHSYDTETGECYFMYQYISIEENKKDIYSSLSETGKKELLSLKTESPISYSCIINII